MSTNLKNYLKTLKLIAEVKNIQPKSFQGGGNPQPVLLGGNPQPVLPVLLGGNPQPVPPWGNPQPVLPWGNPQPANAGDNCTVGLTITDGTMWKASAKVHELTDRPTLDFEMDIGTAFKKALKKWGSAKENPETQEMLLAKQNENRFVPVLRDLPSSIPIYGETTIPFKLALAVGLYSTAFFVLFDVLYSNKSQTSSIYCNVRNPISDEMAYWIENQNRPESKSTFCLLYLLPTNLFNTEKFIENCARKNDKTFDQKSDLEKQIILYDTYNDFVESSQRLSVLFSAGSQIGIFLVITPTVRFLIVLVLKHYMLLQPGLLVDLSILLVSVATANQVHNVLKYFIGAGMSLIRFLASFLRSVFILCQYQFFGKEEKVGGAGEEEKGLEVGGELEYGL